MVRTIDALQRWAGRAASGALECRRHMSASVTVGVLALLTIAAALATAVAASEAATVFTTQRLHETWPERPATVTGVRVVGGRLEAQVTVDGATFVVAGPEHGWLGTDVTVRVSGDGRAVLDAVGDVPVAGHVVTAAGLGITTAAAAAATWTVAVRRRHWSAITRSGRRRHLIRPAAIGAVGVVAGAAARVATVGAGDWWAGTWSVVSRVTVRGLLVAGFVAAAVAGAVAMRWVDRHRDALPGPVGDAASMLDVAVDALPGPGRLLGEPDT